MTSPVLITARQLEAFVASLFVARGMTDEDAAIFAASLVWANMRGIDSHGVSRIPWYFELMDKGEIDPKARPKFRIDAPALFVLESFRSAGPVALTMALTAAITRSRTVGVCIGTIAGTTHTGAIGRYAAMAAKQGCIAMIIGAGSQTMAYHGAAVAGLSTCPIAIGAPGTAEPLIADVATSVAAMGRIQKAQATGGAIPEGWALAADGVPTTDGAKAAIPMPLGGHKGSDLAFMFEILTGVLSGTPTLAPILGGHRSRYHIQNTFLMVIDIAAFRPVDGFKADVSELASVIKSLPRREGFDQLYLPGEWGREKMHARRDGIPIPDGTWSALLGVADRFGVPSPSLDAPGRVAGRDAE